MSTLVWIPGQSGLLGSHLRTSVAEHMIDATVWQPPVLRWNDQSVIKKDIDKAAQHFSSAVRSGEHDRWIIAWCAGTGIIGSTPNELAAESAAFRHLLESLSTSLQGDNRPGTVFFASSAGALYTRDDTIATEQTPVSPLSLYGHEKMTQEEILRSWTERHPHVHHLIGRISTLYGPGQNLKKAQGLISTISLCMLHDTPAHIYVPLDTVRDWIYAKDCADDIVRCLKIMTDDPSHACVTKIFASGQATTVGTILGTFRQIARRPVRVVCSTNPLGSMYRRSIRMRSTVWPDASHRRISLLTGIAAVHGYQTEMYRRGMLPR